MLLNDQIKIGCYVANALAACASINVARYAFSMGLAKFWRLIGIGGASVQVHEVSRQLATQRTIAMVTSALAMTASAVCWLWIGGQLLLVLAILQTLIVVRYTYLFLSNSDYANGFLALQGLESGLSPLL